MSTTTKAQVRAWLREHVTDTEYVKSYEIANDLDCSAKSVGQQFRKLRDDESVPFDIDAWGYSSSTTWLIERRD